MTASRCCVIFSNHGTFPRDTDGCTLPYGHACPHEFVDEDGTIWQWETDWDCTCEECLSGEGDFCSVYWEKPVDYSDV